MVGHGHVRAIGRCDNSHAIASWSALFQKVFLRDSPGAILGHIVLGFELGIFSVLGMVALCGMVANGDFVLTMLRRHYLARCIPIKKATVRAAERRFCSIFLIAITTFLGLEPMIFETNEQTLFMDPMAISLGGNTGFIFGCADSATGQFYYS